MESSFERDRTPSALRALREGLRGMDDEDAVGAILFNSVERLVAASTAERLGTLIHLAAEYRLINRAPFSEWLVELALRLASEPWAASEWAKDRMKSGLEVLLRSTQLVRAARFMVLAVDRQVENKNRPTAWIWTS